MTLAQAAANRISMSLVQEARVNEPVPGPDTNVNDMSMTPPPISVRRINHRLRVDHAVEREREVIERFAVNDGLEDHFLLEATVENRLVDETLDVS